MTPSKRARIPLHQIAEAIQRKSPTDGTNGHRHPTPTPEEITHGRKIYEAFERNTDALDFAQLWRFEKAVQRFNRPVTPTPEQEPTMNPTTPGQERALDLAHRWHVGETAESLLRPPSGPHDSPEPTPATERPHHYVRSV